MTKNTKAPDNNETDQTIATEVSDGNSNHKSVIWATRIVFLLAILIFIWYLVADRRTPYTDQARITELIIPITPRVSGYITDVNIKLNSTVASNDLLFKIDKEPFQLAIQKAKANLDNITQQIGAQDAGIEASASSVGIAKAQLDRAQRNYDRTQRIIKKNPAAVSQADIDRVETSLEQAKEKLSSANANLKKAKEQLGVIGPENPQLRLAIAELEKAQLELTYTNIYASDAGYIESFNIDKGYYAAAGKPLATLVSKNDVWIQADFRENSLSHMKVGNNVKFILDIAPGKIFKGKVRSIGFGVDAGNTVNKGGLPVIKSTSTWLRDSQRFPVIIEFEDEEAITICRAGGQADVVVYASNSWFLNTIANFRIWINTYLSYVR
ncbi:HlyD family secretion protein [Carboxylicivirga marina]|uniref:HlyD family secretion protein n=1 Tax=Carboxylicivirga marina TaxID=2800988 RepID=A0ABS1HK47_9BACT|nr:HlyD family secretion protein [Carboxylicivirga marina]MBK3517927.1 HlyD family secretion protein [Carboxylicivirga marina]